MQAQRSPPVLPVVHMLVGAGKTGRPELAGHCKVGDNVRFRFDLISNVTVAARGNYASRSALVRGGFQPAWTDVSEAIGGGPWLVRNGHVDIDWEK